MFGDKYCEIGRTMTITDEDLDNLPSGEEILAYRAFL